MPFEWDKNKAYTNQEKHGIRFADAVGVFEDGRALNREDGDAQSEHRFIAVGMDFLGRVLTVAYTWRDDNIRIISARPASKKERQTYEHRR